MSWIRVTALPLSQDAVRARMLINLDRVMGFTAVPDGPTQIWFTQNPDEPAMNIAESLEAIELQLGMAMPPDSHPVAGWLDEPLSREDFDGHAAKSS